MTSWAPGIRLAVGLGLGIALVRVGATVDGVDRPVVEPVRPTPEQHVVARQTEELVGAVGALDVFGPPSPVMASSNKVPTMSSKPASVSPSDVVPAPRSIVIPALESRWPTTSVPPPPSDRRRPRRRR